MTGPDAKLTFRGQRGSEEVLLALHQHPWFFFRPGLKVIIAFVLLALIVKVVWLSRLSSIMFYGVTPIVLYVIGHAWFIWSNTVYVLTNERIIAVLQRHWFSRSVTEAPLENVMTVTHSIEGPIRSMLNFGNVSIRSSGASEDEIVLQDVFDPFDVQQNILQSAKK